MAATPERRGGLAGIRRRRSSGAAAARRSTALQNIGSRRTSNVPAPRRRSVIAQPLITLMSDFGLHDPYVGIMKSRIMQRAPQVQLVDLTHEIAPFQPEEAGYWLWCCHAQFPAGTVHVAVVDPGVGGARAIVVLRAAGQVFIAPDNGLLGLISATEPAVEAFKLEPRALAPLGLALDSATFHGRDIMAPLGAEIACGRVRLEQLGTPHRVTPGRLRPAHRAKDGSLHGTIAVIDHFGNALTTIPAGLLGSRPGAHRKVDLHPELHLHPELQLELHLERGLELRRLRMVYTYGEAMPGECVVLINSASMLELATKEGSAAAQLQVRAGQPLRVVQPVG
jgi:S-adenosyl-L-methionine hydrolase (adenosine-forming)